MLYNRGMHAYTMTFVGGGHMASALIGGLMKAGVSPERIRVVDPSGERRDGLHAQWSIHTQDTFDDLAAQVDVLILAVKPQIMPEVLAKISHYLNEDQSPMVISVAGGINLDTIELSLGPRPVVRTMPNTPALVGAGITALIGNDRLEDKHRQWADDLMGWVGECVWLDQEAQIDLVTAISGSGPAYFFTLAEHLVASAIQQGLSPELAQQLAHQTAHGAGQMLKRRDVAAAVLRERVTSPGGTTEAALNVFNARGFAEVVHQAVKAARSRSEALGAQTAMGPSKELD